MKNPYRGSGRGDGRGNILQANQGYDRGMRPPPRPGGAVHYTGQEPFDSGVGFYSLLGPVTGPGRYRAANFHDTPRGRGMITGAGPLRDNRQAPHMQQDHDARMREHRMLFNTEMSRRGQTMPEGPPPSLARGRGGMRGGGLGRGEQPMAGYRGGFTTPGLGMQNHGGMMGGRGQPGGNSFGSRGQGLGPSRGGMRGGGRGYGRGF